MLEQLLQFVKNPVYIEDENSDSRYRQKVFVRLLIYALAVNIGLGFVIGMLEPVFGIDLGEHALDKVMEEYSLAFLFLVAVILAPLMEEVIFRGPMVFFRDKGYFKIVFWLLTLIFGFYHVTNFEITTTVLLLSPLLVLPQIIVGAILGFIRVRFGLPWAIGLHAVYNLILLGPLLLVTALDIPISTE
ncbi:MAG: CPBP family glutamic-type intramembrane protease [Aurantibacter sp.]